LNFNVGVTLDTTVEVVEEYEVESILQHFGVHNILFYTDENVMGVPDLDETIRMVFNEPHIKKAIK